MTCGPAQLDNIVRDLSSEGFEIEQRKISDRVPWITPGALMVAQAAHLMSAAKDSSKGMINKARNLLKRAT